MTFIAQPIVPQAFGNRKLIERACEERGGLEIAVVQTTQGPYMLQGAGVSRLKPSSYVRFGEDPPYEFRSGPARAPIIGSVCFTAAPPSKGLRAGWALAQILGGVWAAGTGIGLLFGDLQFVQAAPTSMLIGTGIALLVAGASAIGGYARAVMQRDDENLGAAYCDAIEDHTRKTLTFEELAPSSAEEQVAAAKAQQATASVA